VARDAKIIELLACATNELPNGDCHQTIYWINKALSLLEVVESVDLKLLLEERLSKLR
jgi:hypothetical protein